MPIEAVFPDELWKVEVRWTPWRSYEGFIKGGSPYDEYAYLYRIGGRFSNNPIKLHYIGKTYRQTVLTRLSQTDHQKRYRHLKKHYPKHALLVSFGLVSLDWGNVTARRITDIEKLLIYAHDDEHLINKQVGLNVKGQYAINNVGHRTPLLPQVYFGVFGRE